MRPYQFDFQGRVAVAVGDNEMQAASHWFLAQPLGLHLQEDSLRLRSQLQEGTMYTCVLSGDVTMHYNGAEDEAAAEDTE